jgi:hypothetical protein
MNSEKSCTALVISQHVLTAKLQIIPLKLLSLFSSLLTKETKFIIMKIEKLTLKEVKKLQKRNFNCNVISKSGFGL